MKIDYEKNANSLFDKIDETLSPILHGKKGPDVFNSITLYYGSCLVSLFMINPNYGLDLIRELDELVLELIRKYQEEKK